MYKKLIFTAELSNDNKIQEILPILSQKNYKIEFKTLNEDFSLIEPAFTLIIGTNAKESTLCKKLNTSFGLATWQCNSFKHITADYYFRQPYDILNLLTSIENPYKNMKWLTTAMEMQFIAQAGLAYTKDRFDHERFTRLSEMAA